MAERVFSFADAGLAGAQIGCLHTALLETLKHVREIYGAEAPQRMAELEAHIVREVKSLVSEQIPPAEEVRIMAPAIEVVRLTFKQANNVTDK